MDSRAEQEKLSDWIDKPIWDNRPNAEKISDNIEKALRHFAVNDNAPKCYVVGPKTADFLREHELASIIRRLP